MRKGGDYRPPPQRRVPAAVGLVAIATVAPLPKAGYGRSMSSFPATAVSNTNRNNLRANNRARPMRDCDQG